MQGIYQWLFTGADASEVLKNLSEMEGFASADPAFLEAQLRGTIAESDSLTRQLEPLADRKWAEVSPVERSILLMGAWELVHKQEIPYRVTINEAIELGKRFGATDGHKWVNGVLDRLAATVRAAEIAAPREPRAPRQKERPRSRKKVAE
jgi:N utilization substance protein B